MLNETEPIRAFSDAFDVARVDARQIRACPISFESARKVASKGRATALKGRGFKPRRAKPKESRALAPEVKAFGPLTDLLRPFGPTH